GCISTVSLRHMNASSLFESRGRAYGTTRMITLHDCVWPVMYSVASHVTVVGPTLNSEPLGGVHVASPSPRNTVAVGYVIATGPPFGDFTVCASGHTTSKRLPRFS